MIFMPGSLGMFTEKYRPDKPISFKGEPHLQNIKSEFLSGGDMRSALSLQLEDSLKRLYLLTMNQQNDKLPSAAEILRMRTVQYKHMHLADPVEPFLDI